MKHRLRTWLDAIPLSDPIERRQAGVFQLILICWIILSIGWILLLVFLFTQPPPPGTEIAPEQLPPIFFIAFFLMPVSFLFWWSTPVAALVLLRRGHFKAGVWVATMGMLLAHGIGTYILGTIDPSVLVVFQLPIAMAGLLASRRLLLTAAGLSVAIVVGVSTLQSMNPRLAAFLASAPGGTTEVYTSPLAFGGVAVLFFVAVTLVLTLLLDRFGGTFRAALVNSLEREAELEQIRASLEGVVTERTALLQKALDEVQARAAEQAELLTRIDVQHATIRDLSVPVIPISSDKLIMPLVGALDDARLQQIQEQSLQALERTAARVLILDITGVPIVDSQVAQGLLLTVRAARLLGADVALVGIRPEVAQTIVGLGITFQDIRTFSDLQSALVQIST